MIYDKLSNFKNYTCLNQGFKEVLDFIENNDLTALPLGKVDLSEKVFYNRQEYFAKEEKDDLYESHLDYIDVQIVLSGIEKHNYSCASPLKQEINQKDCYFTNAKKDCNLILDGSNFVIFFPNELHKPGLNVDGKQVQKIVFKVRG